MKNYMLLGKYVIGIIVGFTAISINASAQQIPIPMPAAEGSTAVATDTANKGTVPRTAIKPYDKVITKEFSSYKGMFTVHRLKDRILFEIPDSLLNRSVLIINRLTKISALMGMYPGEQLDEKTIIFEKGKDSTVNLKYEIVVNEADSGSMIYKAVANSSLNPTFIKLPIMAYGNKSSVIEVTRMLKEKTLFNSVMDGAPLAKAVNMTTVKDIEIESIKAFPINVEIKISKSATGTPSGLPAGSPVSLETNTSFVLLPEKPMQRRYSDDRVGYFDNYFYQFSDGQQKVETKEYVKRWRLEPKPGDMEKWKKGELVEPAKPIVIYIDPATPKQWRKHLIAGINDWQAAFEQAGFKNAIIGKEWPENDSTMSMDDARFSFVNYLASTIPNAYGPSVQDPRSGEIIQTRIGWYHNVMTILKNWYMVQTAAVDTEARKVKFDEELMGNLIRFVSSHEVGHTLGLRHNFGSSSQTPVDSLRSNSYLSKYGHTASIMDYARFNYVAQPEDKITRENLFPRIGEYDKWAIEFGYKYLNGSSAEEENKLLKKEIAKRNAANKRLWFGNGETERFDPRCQTEDLGDDAAAASRYGIKNLKRIVKDLPKWTFEEDGVYKNLTDAYSQVFQQYYRYMGHVMKYIGSFEKDIRVEGEALPVFSVVPKEKQLGSMAFFNDELFTTPTWLLNTDLTDKVYSPRFPNFVSSVQERVLNTMLDGGVMNRIVANEISYGKAALPLTEYVGTVHQFIWKELKGSTSAIDIYRRNLQKVYIGAVADILGSIDPLYTENDVTSILKSDVKKIAAEIKAYLPKVTDAATRSHLQDIADRIKHMDELKG